MFFGLLCMWKSKVDLVKTSMVCLQIYTDIKLIFSYWKSCLLSQVRNTLILNVLVFKEEILKFDFYFYFFFLFFFFFSRNLITIS